MTAKSSPLDVRRWFWRAVVIITLLVVGWFYAWTIESTKAVTDVHGAKNDYYNLLVHGFLDGHTYMKVAVDPALLALPPTQRPGSAPYLLDASLYGDHYHLYFGVTPVLLIFAPYRLLTGSDVPEALAAGVLALIGTGLAVAWWLEARRRFFPQLGGRWVVLGVIALGFCTAVPSMLRRPSFYEVAIASGYACTMFALWAALRAWTRPAAAGRWLAFCGVALGLAVGSRANLLPGVLLFAVAVALNVARRAKVSRGWSLRRIGLAMAAVGAGLAVYNAVRFGSPLEFGHRYQFGINPQQMFRTSNLGHNLGVYYFTPPTMQGYFPFVAPGVEADRPADYLGREHAHGEWVWMAVAGLAGLMAGWVRFRREKTTVSNLWILIGPLLALFLVNGVVVGLTGVRANRYMLDFHPALVLATLLLLATGAEMRDWLTRLLAALAAAGIAAATVFNVFASLQAQGFFATNNPISYATISAAADRVVWPWLRGEAEVLGDRRLSLRWPARIEGRLREPLVSAGTPGLSDVVWLDYDRDGQRARFVYQHAEYGEAVGEWFDYEPGGDATVEVSGALLLPGTAHPWFGDMPQAQRLAMKRRLRIVVDGRDRFSRDVPSYDSSPRLQRWGAWREYDGQAFGFSGVIARVEPRLADDRWAVGHLDGTGAWRLLVMLPSGRFGQTDPLLQTGAQGRCDTVAVCYARPGVVQLVHDQVGSGAVRSAEFAVDYEKPQFVEIELPEASDRIRWTAQGPVETTRTTSQLRVRWNGEEVFVSGIAPRPVAPGETVVGGNWGGSTVSRTMFGGVMGEVARLQPLGPTGPGTLSTCIESLDTWVGVRGELIHWHRPDGEVAALLWRRAQSGAEIQLGWLEGGETRWSAGVKPAALERLEVTLPARSFLAAGIVRIAAGGTMLTEIRTAYFASGSVAALAVRPEQWSGSGLAGRNEVKQTLGERELPGRVRLRFVLPPAGLHSSDPLLSAGKPGAADSVYLREVAENRFVLGLDHWGVSALESAPISLDRDAVHTLLVELGSICGHGEVPSDVARLTLDGHLVLDHQLKLYPVRPDEFVIGRNPLGMSSSGPEFRGEIISVRKHWQE